LAGAGAAAGAAGRWAGGRARSPGARGGGGGGGGAGEALRPPGTIDRDAGAATAESQSAGWRRCERGSVRQQPPPPPRDDFHVDSLPTQDDDGFLQHTE